MEKTQFDYIKVFHLSHIDLDGYGCMFLTNHYMGKVCPIVHYTSNYGYEMNMRIEEIMRDIKRQLSTPLGQSLGRVLFKITDLNLNAEQSKTIDTFVKQYDNLDLILLDHHSNDTTIKISRMYPWYHLDSERCGTKLTHDLLTQYDFKVEHENKSLISEDAIVKFVRCVNAWDLWLTDDTEHHELGSIFNDYVMESSKFDNITMRDITIDYKIKLINSAISYLEKGADDAASLCHIMDADRIKVERNSALTVLSSTDDIHIGYFTLRNVLVELESNKAINSDIIKVFKYTNPDTNNKSKFVLLLNSSNINLVSRRIFKAHPEIDFVLTMNTLKGSMSARGHDRVDLDNLMRTYFNGGGHANAAGGRIKLKAEIFDYETAVQEIINKTSINIVPLYTTNALKR